MIETVGPHNLQLILPLIRQYQQFYQVAVIDDAKNQTFFSQFGPDQPQGCQFVYMNEGVPTGFATLYFSFSSTLAEKVGVMNDLYVLPECRGGGMGKALIQHCLDYALKQGAYRLQWTTAMDNLVAQSTYNALNTQSKPWLFYTYRGEQN
ncbi:MAG: GNAT family N-acetyltransferase [Hahellaceae bacterium]|nr:GNAT family N-acetyltransferase [Hahellaceae bacterium]MCP5169347.1 GNAT family N-acetyltransferase [Hahellaceae bacterium]